MALAMLPLDDRSSGREMLSRVFAVAGALFSLMALITAGVAADALALTRAPQTAKPGWASRFRAAMTAKKG